MAESDGKIMFREGSKLLSIHLGIVIHNFTKCVRVDYASLKAYITSGRAKTFRGAFAFGGVDTAFQRLVFSSIVLLSFKRMLDTGICSFVSEEELGEAPRVREALKLFKALPANVVVHFRVPLHFSCTDPTSFDWIERHAAKPPGPVKALVASSTTEAAAYIQDPLFLEISQATDLWGAPLRGMYPQ